MSGRRMSITKEDVDNNVTEIVPTAADETALGSNVEQIAADATDPTATTLDTTTPILVDHKSGPVVVNGDAADSDHLAPPPADILKKVDTETAGAVTVRPDE